MGLIPGGGTQIPHARCHSKKKKERKRIQFTGNTGSEKQVKTPPQESNQTNPEVGHFAELTQSLYQITET